jgi:hypothetical protein
MEATIDIPIAEPVPAPSFADRLRLLADFYDAHPGLPEPNVFLCSRSYGPTTALSEFSEARAAAVGDVTIEAAEYGYVLVPVPGDFLLRFNKQAVGQKRTVTREVVEYVLPELAVSARAASTTRSARSSRRTTSRSTRS